MASQSEIRAGKLPSSSAPPASSDLDARVVRHCDNVTQTSCGGDAPQNGDGSQVLNFYIWLSIARRMRCRTSFRTLDITPSGLVSLATQSLLLS